MKRERGIAGVLLGICLLLTACQPTPEKEIIVQKDTLSIITADGAVATGGEEGEKRDLSAYSVPERYCYETEDTSGRVHLQVDAEVVMPEGEHMPVARISPRPFTEKDAKKLYEALMSDTVSIAPNGPRFKGYWQPALDELIEQKNSGKWDMKYATEEDLDAAIGEVVKKMAVEPDEPIPVSPAFSFTRYDRSEEIALWGVRKGLHLATLDFSNSTDAQDAGAGSQAAYVRNVWNSNEFSSVRNSYTSDILWEAQASGATFSSPTISPEDGRKIAEEAMEQAGFMEEYTFAGERVIPLYETLEDRNETCKNVYEFMYTRCVLGVAETFTNTAVALGTDDLTVMCPWHYERIRIFVDDEGIYALLWDSPSAVEVLYEDVALLPFEQIQSIFEAQFMLRYGAFTTDKTGGKYEIKEVKLGLMRICEKDHTTNALLVPVWDFFGTCTGEDGSVKGLDGFDSWLTINAIDGSIIDRQSGY